MKRTLSLILMTVLMVSQGCLSVKSGAPVSRRDDQSGSKLMLVENGGSRAPIVIFKDAPPLTRAAADELAVYIGKISGAQPEVIEGCPDPLPEHAVWVGYQPVLEKLFPKVDLEFKHPEEILVAANEDHLLVAGRDRWDPDNLALNETGTGITGIQQEYGTCNAVYTFIQDYLGVRWIWPGELGEDIPEHKTIAFEPFTFRYHPQIRSRGGVFTYSRLGRGAGYGRSHQWVRHQRLQLDSLSVGGGHGFADWWERFHETHPEYFALQPDGTRSGFPSPRTTKMCLSNPGLWDQWIVEVEKQIEANPNQRIFSAAENDGWASGYCVCEKCRAWDHPDGELRLFRWAGINQEYVAMSDRQVTLANHLARKLKQRFPDKEYYVNICAYGHSRPGPLAVVPDDNVVVLSVANFLTNPDAADRGSPAGTLHKDQFAEWARAARNLFWRPNISRKWVSMPLFPLEETLRDFRFVADNHCMGIFVDMIWEHWATRGPLYYAIAQMTWNPRQDGEALMDDYYRRGFGKAAAGIRAYWSFMHDTWEQSRKREYELHELLDAAFFKKAYSLLDRAQQSVAGEPEKYGRRIEFVRRGLDYTHLVTEAHEMMVRFGQSGGTDKAAEARALKIWLEEIKALAADEEYPYAVNWGPTRPGHGHMKSGRFPKGLPRVW